MQLIIKCDCGNIITIDKDLDKFDLARILEENKLNIGVEIIYNRCDEAIGASFGIECKKCNSYLEIESV